MRNAEVNAELGLTPKRRLQHLLQHSAFSIPHCVLLVCALLPYFVNLGSSSIWDANEAFYVETPREMMERGDYIFPTFNYEPRVNKPVLSYWIVAGFYHLFGVSVGVQRVPIAIGAIVLIATAFFLARAAAPDRVASSAALWAALGLAVSPRLLIFARRIFIDIYISMFMALTLLFFALAERYPERRRLFLLLMYASVGLGVLTKGPVAVVLPGLAFAAYLIVHRELRRITEMMIPAGVAVVLAIVVPWYASLYRVAGWEPIKSFVLGENYERFAHGVGVSADRPFWWYVPVVFSDSFPWSLLLVAAGVAWFRDRRARVTTVDSAFRVRTLLWLWILTIVGFFSFSVAKQDLYIFPIVPAVVALAGVAIARASESAIESATPRINLTTALMGIVLAIAGAGFLFLFQGSNVVYALAGSAAVGAFGVTGGLGAVLLAWRKRAPAGLALLAAALIAVNWTFVLKVMPSFEVYKPAPGLAAALQERAAPTDVIVTYNVALPSLVYYLRRHIDVFYEHDEALRLLRTNAPMFVMASEDDYNRILAPALPAGAFCRVTSRPTFDVKLRNVLAQERLPEIVLMTNKCGAQ
jgi:4-amino-4-deoxy-L-arabinose transferase-like glycosyltransferase